MIGDRSGLTPVRLEDAAGTQLHIPYRVPAHGFYLLAPASGIALLVLPISAIEDPRFLRWLGRRGIYRIEDPSGSLARIGEGRVIDRLRTHRLRPVLVPGRVSAAFALNGEWPYSTRRYLEARLAASWTEDGNGLTNRTFNWTILNTDSELRIELDGRHLALRSLLEASDRILDHDADEFVATLAGTAFEDAPAPLPLAGRIVVPFNPAPVRLRQTRHGNHVRVFPQDSSLRYDDGLINAIATVRDDGVVLEPGSRVYRTTGGQAGRKFRLTHRQFLTAARVTDGNEFGTTRSAVIADSAAFLIKNVTGGRVHVASRWQIS